MSTADATSLYRHFAADGALLYVGIALSWPVRTRTHARSARWFEDVARVEIEHFPTREAALVAEREAIQRERPKFNVMHNREARPAPRGKARANDDPVLGLVRGPDAIVGPPLIYRDDFISIIVAHGETGKPGVLDEIVLGRHSPDVDLSWAHLCATVMVVRRADEITMAQAQETRREIIGKLTRRLRTVEAFDTDIALALANASRFPSAKARAILDDVAHDRSAA